MTPTLRAAYAAMADALGPAVTVEPMAAAGVEISVGIVRDEAFGPLLVVAAGGTLVELLADRAVACPPVLAHRCARTAGPSAHPRRCWPAGAGHPQSTSTRWRT